MNKFRIAISKHSLPLFFLLSYAWSWGCWLLISRVLDVYKNELQGASTILIVSEIPILLRVGFVLAYLTGTFGPAIAAISISVMAGGKAALRELLGRVVKWRVNIRYYLAAFLVPPVILFLCIGLITFWGGQVHITISTSSLLVALGMYADYFFRSGGQEELGFRGFAQQRLQMNFNPFFTTLIIGALWFFWHLPLYLWIPEASQYQKPLLFGLLQQIGFCFTFTWIYSETKSVLLPMLLHATINFVHSFLLVDVSDTNADLIFTIGLIVFYSAFGAWLIWRDRARNFHVQG